MEARHRFWNFPEKEKGLGGARPQCSCMPAYGLPAMHCVWKRPNACMKSMLLDLFAKFDLLPRAHMVRPWQTVPMPLRADFFLMGLLRAT